MSLKVYPTSGTQYGYKTLVSILETHLIIKII